MIILLKNSNEKYLGMKKLVLLCVFVFTLNMIFGAKVDTNTAKIVAQNFYGMLNPQNQQKSTISLTLVYDCKSHENIQKSTENTISYYYVFNVSDNNGFVIVAGDNTITPILAYSTTNNFDAKNIPINVKKWLEGYKNEINFALNHSSNELSSITKEWNDLIDGQVAANQKSTASVSSLLSTTWDQSPYYNDLCPYNYYYSERTVTGCVATAMAQIMKFWNYPSQGIGFHSYVHNTYGTLSANFASTTYNWAAMPNNVSYTNQAVATLMYHCGVSVDMNYGTATEGGSGAYVYLDDDYIAYGYMDARTAMKNNFGYTTAAGYSRDDYSLSSWISKLKTELDAGRPILYSGSGTNGGHAFVCDGYDNTDKFHMNWGWSGYYDGYFVISALNPAGTGTGGGSGGFNSNQKAVMGIKPPTVNPNAELRLYSYLDLYPTSISYGQSFTLSTSIANYGSGSFSGEYAAFIFDNNYNFVCGMDTISSSLSSGYYEEVEFSTNGMLQLVPGTYYLAVFCRTTSGNWSMVDKGSYSNIVTLTVSNSSDIELYSDFVISPSATQIFQGESISVNCDILNTSSYTFSGTLYLCLYNIETGDLVFQIDNEVIASLPSGYHYTNGIDFTNSDLDVSPGSYLLALMYKPSSSSSAYIVGSTYKQNPIVVVVQEAPTQADAFEPNNDHQSAYNLTVKFSQDEDLIQTTGSNLHTGLTKDYYKVVLPEGYDYKLKAEVYDAYNFPKNQSYTCDVLLSYFTAESDWSDAFDEKLIDSIFVEDGGTVYFFVSPFSEGSTGTYLLNLYVRRISKASINQITDESSLQIYPNPVKEIVCLNSKDVIKDVEIFDMVGKKIMAVSINDNKGSFSIGNLTAGVYITRVRTDKGFITKKFIKD